MTESPFQKWVNISYLAVSALLAFIVFNVSMKFVGIYDLETRVKDIEWVVRGAALGLGLLLFFLLWRSVKTNQFMGEVMTELSRVTWPTQKETTGATIMVIIMVLISGMVLGFFDYLWTVLLKWML